MENTHRTLKLSHDEIERIEWALACVFGNQMRYLASEKCMLEYEDRKSVMKNSDRYDGLRTEIKEGLKDV